jgi:hypothetical protein
MNCLPPRFLQSRRDRPAIFPRFEMSYGTMNVPNAPAPLQEPPDEQPQITVTTLPFALTPKEYFRITLRGTFWKIWWCFLFLGLTSLVLICLLVLFSTIASAYSQSTDKLVSCLILVIGGCVIVRSGIPCLLLADVSQGESGTLYGTSINDQPESCDCLANG